MEFAILGPLEVRDEGRLVDVGGPKHRVLLALLLLNANRVVSTDRLLEALWGNDALGMENALWVHISRLRTALGERDLLVTCDHGYSLAVDPNDIDVHRFESMAADGHALVRDDPEAALQLLNDALGLWRGPALEEFTYDDFAQIEITRLEELHLLAREDRFAAELDLGRAGELISELEAFHREHPTRERVVGQLMLALYRSRRQTEALQVFRRFRLQLVELGLAPSAELQRLEEQILLHDSRLDAHQRSADLADEPPSPMPTANPFKGLRAFGEADSADFFGRERIVAEAVRRLDGGRDVIGIVGPSGSGKSSIVRAGLIPTLRKGAIEGSDRWVIAAMVPGSRPFAELEAALLRSSPVAPDSLSEQLADRETGLLRAILRVLPSDSDRLLLVIDQFEELFTLVPSEDERLRFLTGLIDAVDDSRGRLMVVIALRADFYDRPLSYPEFGARLGGGIINVVPLTSDELEMAAQRPAERAGVAPEPALVAALLTDVIGRPGGLPLFQFTLTELFDRRDGDTLSLSAYQAMGGLSGALGHRADDIYAQLDDEQQAAARQLFLRLVNIADNDEWTRRRVPASELLSLDVDVLALQTVIDDYAANRLLVLDRDVVTDSPTVEVAHEALLTDWEHLRAWIESAREDVRRHAWLAVAMNEWREADEDPDYLLSAGRLEAYATWAASALMHLTLDEQRFLEASTRHSEQEVEEQHRQLASTARAERSARRRLWAIAAMLLVGAVLAGLLMLRPFGDTPVPTVAFFGYRGDGGWNDNMASGLDRAAQDLDFELVDAPAVVDPPADFRALAETGPDVIISDATPTIVAPEVFTDFPEIRFGVVDGVVDSPNTAGVRFSNEQGAFLAGAAAAMKTETGVVGFVGGDPSIVSDFQAGFESGAHWIDPEVEVLSTYVLQQFANDVGGIPIFAFGRPDLGYARAAALYEMGADVVFHAAGASGLGLFDAVVDQSRAQGRPLWAIGVDNDQWFDVDEVQRPHVLTSVIKRGDVAARLLVERLLGDEPVGGVERVGVAEGAFGYSTQGDGLTDEMTATLARAETAIADGDIVVPTEPTGPVLDLDPIQNAGEKALSVLTLDQADDFLHDWLPARYPEEIASYCSFTNSSEAQDAACLDVVLSHLEEFVAQL